MDFDSTILLKLSQFNDLISRSSFVGIFESASELSIKQNEKLHMSEATHFRTLIFVVFNMYNKYHVSEKVCYKFI